MHLVLAGEPMFNNKKFSPLQLPLITNHAEQSELKILFPLSCEQLEDLKRFKQSYLLISC